ncbi:MAG TPA: beta-ketoacyl-ACP synthase 3 [Solirubrobacteraceae bacterium]|nr:beta-ketoacyl-ACP synthase 3 [Solirubrobacteraceae bacterium]
MLDRETAAAPDAPLPTGVRRAAALSVGTALPPDVTTTAELVAGLDGADEEWIVSRTGIRARRYAAPGVRVTDLAVQAGAEALAKAGVDAADVDLVIVGTLAPDELTPNAAPLVAHQLGADRAGAFDVGAACNAFLSGLATGATFVETGRAEHVLVIGAEVLSRFIDRANRKTAAIFGDGAGAVVLGPASESAGLGPVVLRQDGSLFHTILATHDGRVIEMDGQETFRHAVNRMVEVTGEALDAAGIALDDVDLFVYHQANQRITRSVGQRLGLDPEKVVDCIAETGNTSAATLPLALAAAEADGRLRDGSRVLLAAFGAGFAWGGAVLEWGA